MRFPWRSAPIWVVLVALFAAACSGDGGGVGVDARQTDVAFGAPEEEADDDGDSGAEAAPATATTTPALTTPPRSLRKDFLDALPPSRPVTRRECPAAAIDEFPEEEASLNADEAPEEGVRRWKTSGTQALTVGGGASEEVPLEFFRDRLVQNVDQVDETTWTFETVEREFNQIEDGDVLITTFRVRTDAESRNVNALSVEERAGAPDRGVSLVRLDRYDSSDGNLIGSFAPTPPILYLPLPVVPGENYQAFGLDPRTGESVTHTATVVERSRVDACGEIVEGWRVESTQASSGSVFPTRSPYNYIVAPHLGGIIISEHIEGSSAVGSYKVTSNVAEIDARPLPDDAEAAP